MNRTHMHRRAQCLLPAAIETNGLLHFGTAPGQVEGSLLASLFGQGAQGLVVLRLASSTAVAVQRQGLAFFEQARMARAGLLRRCLPVRYACWTRMQLLKEQMRPVENGEEKEADWNGAAYVAAVEGRRAWLAVLPVERLVVYGWGE